MRDADPWTSKTIGRRRTAALAALLLLAGCEKVEEIREQYRAPTPRAGYEAALRAAGLAGTALARDWSAAARRALTDALPVETPFREAGYLPPEQPSAVGYRIRVRRGQRLVVEARLEPDTTALLFLDLFRLDGDSAREPRRVASADSGAHRLEYEPWRDGEFVVRLQPELLRGGRYTLTIHGTAILAFPVAGADARSIRSIFGDPRDGGARDHHGVDIFAPRGTPVLAAIDGIVTRVRETPRGGKVVWLRDEQRSNSLYYAHLDRQLVAEGMHVRPGDTLGLVGNTGNARTTPPHLHFGIYRRREGPLDPYPFVDWLDTVPSALAVDTTLLGRWTRAARDGTRLRASPAVDAPLVGELPRYTAMRVLGGSAGWYRVTLPDGRSGFVAGRLMEDVDEPVRSEVLLAARNVLDRPAAAAVVIDTLAPGQTLPVLARFGEFLYVQAPGGRTAWLPPAD